MKGGAIPVLAQARDKDRQGGFIHHKVRSQRPEAARAVGFECRFGKMKLILKEHCG